MCRGGPAACLNVGTTASADRRYAVSGWERKGDRSVRARRDGAGSNDQQRRETIPRAGERRAEEAAAAFVSESADARAGRPGPAQHAGAPGGRGLAQVGRRTTVGEERGAGGSSSSRSSG